MQFQTILSNIYTTLMYRYKQFTNTVRRNYLVFTNMSSCSCDGTEEKGEAKANKKGS